METAFNSGVANFTHEVIGVIGGCGVAAAIELLHLIEKKLVLEYGCTDDSQEPEMLLYQATQAPNRIAYASGISSVSFAPYFINAAKMLKNSGATFGCIPCNTAHCVIDQIEKESSLPFINLIDQTIEYITKVYPVARKIGILCSDGTVHAKIYEQSVGKKSANLTIIYPTSELQKSVSAGICAVKSGLQYQNLREAERYFIDSMDELISVGVDLIILGCTEIPLAVTADTYKNVPLINTLSVLADACIERCRC
ncbi:MAG: amino acid racemase [Opitutales bacterium]|nr:amino acid racemase [Opitutales bacterium]